jgi:hypothetical protein
MRDLVFPRSLSGLPDRRGPRGANIDRQHVVGERPGGLVGLGVPELLLDRTGLVGNYIPVWAVDFVRAPGTEKLRFALAAAAVLLVILLSAARDWCERTTPSVRIS